VSFIYINTNILIIIQTNTTLINIFNNKQNKIKLYMTDNKNSDRLQDDIKLQISLDPHSKETVLFLKHFGDNHKYTHASYELDNDAMKLASEYIDTVYNLDYIFSNTYVGYEDFKTEEGTTEVTHSHPDNLKDQPYNPINRLMIDIAKKVIIDFGYDYIKIISLTPTTDDIKEELKRIQFDGFSNKTKNSVHVLASSQDRGMYLSDFEIDGKYTDLDIATNYNDDFLPIYENILKNLNKDQIGLYLLHGTHGTGKTTLIRHLIRKINKRLIFISPSMASQFSSPDMIPFLMKYPNSIIIIEDSENIIKERVNGSDQSVSNLLNLSDGILGDCLKFQIICTFNTAKEEIDQALYRKGRLIESYEFKKLSKEKSNNLQRKLGYKESNEDMRLSDIYNPEENHFDVDRERIGFN
jgi:hypothetical protein